MKSISLRKAHRLVSTIIKKIAEVENNTSCRTQYVEYKDISETRLEAIDKFNININTYGNLTDVLFEIRDIIQVANTERINDLLLKKAKLTKYLMFISKISNDYTVSGVYNFDAISSNKNIHITGREKSGSSYPFSFNGPILDSAQISDFDEKVRTVQKKLDLVNEEIEELNHSVKVEISTAVVEFLSGMDLM
ncbi:MAG: hypothetical protein L0Y61_01760 [Epsilonproteobacteria bacterium]|nr:hypothetical protein [Campylobacterota bacterium]